MRWAALALLLALPASAFVPKDRAQHFTAGLGAGALSFVALPMFLPESEPWAPWAAAVGSAALAGVAKEVADAFGAGQPDALDALWTVVGGAVGAVASDFLINRLPPLSRGDWKKAVGFAFRGAF